MVGRKIGAWFTGASLGLQEHRGSAKADSKPSTKDDIRPKHADRQRLPEGLAAIFLSFSGDARHNSAGFLICLRDPDCRSKILDITKHSV